MLRALPPTSSSTPIRRRRWRGRSEHSRRGNVFFCTHQYWAFAKGGWYVGPSCSGPWVVVEPAYVPMPVLRVPVRYYAAPPPSWKGWRREAPPQGGASYGREWHEAAHERNWREREEQWNRDGGKGCPPGLAKQGRC